MNGNVEDAIYVIGKRQICVAKVVDEIDPFVKKRIS